MAEPDVDPQFAAAVADRFAALRDRVSAAGGSNVGILAVTKSFGLDACWAAHLAGCVGVGENYAQELVGKFSGHEVPWSVHFIGQLQTNKVRLVAPYVSVVESVDRPSLVAELARRMPTTRVLVQVDTVGGGHGRGGCPVDQVPALVDAARAADLDVAGLMTVGPPDADPVATRAGFRLVRRLVDRLGLHTCSMGMSADLEIAVQEGSTQVRVGSALFGERPLPTAAAR